MVLAESEGRATNLCIVEATGKDLVTKGGPTQTGTNGGKLGPPPNGLQISCKRPAKSYVPYRLRELHLQRNSGPPAFVGCICGLGSAPVRSKYMGDRTV